MNTYITDDLVILSGGEALAVSAMRQPEFRHMSAEEIRSRLRDMGLEILRNSQLAGDVVVSPGRTGPRFEFRFRNGPYRQPF